MKVKVTGSNKGVRPEVAVVSVMVRLKATGSGCAQGMAFDFARNIPRSANSGPAEDPSFDRVKSQSPISVLERASSQSGSTNQGGPILSPSFS